MSKNKGRICEEEIKLKEMFHTVNSVKKCKDVELLETGLSLCDGANHHPFLENWFYAIHDRLDYLDPTGEEV